MKSFTIMKFYTLAHKIVIDHQQNFHEVPCKADHVGVVNARVNALLQVRAFMFHSHVAFAEIDHFIMSLRLKIDKDLSLC